MSYVDILRADLIVDEGDRSKPYIDTKGKVTIGIGRNLTDDGIAEDEKELMFSNDVGMAESIAEGLFKGFYQMSPNRQAALANLAFNMGERTLETFTVFIGLVNAQNWSAAADDLLQTKWATEVGPRAQRRADQIRNG